MKNHVNIKDIDMNRIIKKDGYVYLVEGERKGFETYHNLGKDKDDPIWEKEVEDMKDKIRKRRKTKKEDND